eukprot:CAMPEP_0198240382 /NCGR_PEP_ID=MMETSP1446-20131203/5507_1 /TAXON_ID=1461542 ORGANISM="Unidentified sp, Strain CCMP2111" /NCGR_SAMPLE_ID=MMETSP1446 /ASSEMBLY_ACC=CAM_ASM_001112 /LENGTH=93 /DNA_ID=CAMNT_0043923101 /DNA_START=765 /DNA_END=1044 /DNA_ORIENTATION=-
MPVPQWHTCPSRRGLLFAAVAVLALLAADDAVAAPPLPTLPAVELGAIAAQPTHPNHPKMAMDGDRHETEKCLSARTHARTQARVTEKEGCAG